VRTTPSMSFGTHGASLAAGVASWDGVGARFAGSRFTDGHILTEP
jgi:hypothetical protein